MKKIVIDIIARYLLFPKLCYPGITMGLLPLVKKIQALARPPGLFYRHYPYFLLG